MSKQLTRFEIELAVKLLEGVSGELSSRVSSDLFLPDSWTQQQCDEFLLAMHIWNKSPENYRPGERMTMDYFARDYLVARLREACEAASCESAGLGTPSQPIVRSLPNAVMQTTPTDCFRACVAVVLGIPIGNVPASCDGLTWDWAAFQDWLALRGLQAIEIRFGSGGTVYPVTKPVLCILAGASPRECVTGRHAVVGEFVGLGGFRLLHDPHPSGAWIEGEPTHVLFFVSVSS